MGIGPMRAVFLEKRQETRQKTTGRHTPVCWGDAKVLHYADAHHEEANQHHD